MLRPGDRRLVFEAGLLLFIVSVAVRVFSFPTLRRLLSDPVQDRQPPGQNVSRTTAQRVGWAVSAAARRVPWRSTCLIETLAAAVMLQRRRCPYDVRFGVRLSSPSADLHAHAWLEHEGYVVVGDHGNLSDYAMLSARSATP